MKHTGFSKFFAKADWFPALLRMLYGVKKDPRFANQPAWLKAEMLDKAASKRLMRQRKRVGK